MEQLCYETLEKAGRNGNTCQLSLQHAFGRSYRASSQFFSITY